MLFIDPTGHAVEDAYPRGMGSGVYGGIDLISFRDILDALARASAGLEQAVTGMVSNLITPAPSVLTHQPIAYSLPISVGEVVPVADTVSGTDVAGGTASPSPDDPNGDKQRKRMEEKARQYNNTSAKGLLGKEFEDYLTETIGGEGSFKVDGREFDGGVGSRWWEAKSGDYWNHIKGNPRLLNNFYSDMGDRLRIAKEHGATYELFSNTPIPDFIKDWLTKHGIRFAEILD